VKEEKRSDSHKAEYNSTLLDELTEDMLQERRELKDGKLGVDKAYALNESARNIIAVQVANVKVNDMTLQREKLRAQIRRTAVSEREVTLKEMEAAGMTPTQIKNALGLSVAPVPLKKSS